MRNRRGGRRPRVAPFSIVTFASTLARFAIVSVWLGLLVVLWQDSATEEPKAEPVVLPLVAESAGGERWMGLYMGDRKVGYSSSSTEPTDSGFTLRDRSVLRLRVLEINQTIHATTTAETDADFALRSFRVRLDSGVGEFDVDGVVAGGVLKVTLRTGSHVDERNFPVAERIFTPSGLRASIVRDGLRAGAERSAPVFDPAAMAAEPLVIRAVGRESIAAQGGSVEVWRLVESYRGIETVVWVDDAGETLREQGPMGLVAVRESAVQATGEGWGDGSLVDLMAAVAVPVEQPIRGPRGLDQVRLRISGLGPLQVPSDERQQPSDGVVAVRREVLDGGDSFVLPYRDGPWVDDLAATSFVQSQHPRIVDTARKVVEDERDARAAAIRLRRWVYDALEKKPVASIPNALQVLEMGMGDCNEHAVLFAALARAVGLPARVVAGVVYADGVFLYHAWNEVWLGQRWISVDTAFDQMPVDATHIKLLIGEPDQHVALVPAIGNLAISVVESTDG